MLEQNKVNILISKYNRQLDGIYYRSDKWQINPIISAFWEFLKFRKRYWLLPIVLVLFLFGALIVFTESSAVAPFIYALY